MAVEDQPDTEETTMSESPVQIILTADASQAVAAIMAGASRTAVLVDERETTPEALREYARLRRSMRTYVAIPPEDYQRRKACWVVLKPDLRAYAHLVGLDQGDVYDELVADLT